MYPPLLTSVTNLYRTSWIIDSQRIASKIKNVSGSLDLSKQKWRSNPSKECPSCSHIIDNSDVRAVHLHFYYSLRP
jgi:hypothetical protein